MIQRRSKTPFDIGLLFELEEGLQLRKNQLLIQSALLPYRNTLNIQPVFLSIGKCLEHDEIFSTASFEVCFGSHTKVRCPRDGPLFKGHGTQRDVDGNSFLAFQEYDAGLDREVAAVFDTTFEMVDKGRDIGFLRPETRKDREVHVLS